MTLKNLQIVGKKANKQQKEYALTVFKTVEKSVKVEARFFGNCFIAIKSVDYVLFPAKNEVSFEVTLLTGEKFTTDEIIVY